MKKWMIRIRSAVLVFLTHKIALPMLKLLRRPNVFTYSMEELKDFPTGSLGKDLYHFLTVRGLPLLKHYARHDLKHILLEYDTTDDGEACLQSFMLGNGRISFPVLATVIYGFITMPEYWKQMRLAFRKGRGSKPLYNWEWNGILREPTQDLRDRIFLYPNKRS